MYGGPKYCEFLVRGEEVNEIGVWYNHLAKEAVMQKSYVGVSWKAFGDRALRDDACLLLVKRR